MFQICAGGCYFCKFLATPPPLNFKWDKSVSREVYLQKQYVIAGKGCGLTVVQIFFSGNPSELYSTIIKFQKHVEIWAFLAHFDPNTPHVQMGQMRFQPHFGTKIYTGEEEGWGHILVYVAFIGKTCNLTNVTIIWKKRIFLKIEPPLQMATMETFLLKSPIILDILTVSSLVDRFQVSVTHFMVPLSNGSVPQLRNAI